jgi:hypothetical protein
MKKIDPYKNGNKPPKDTNDIDAMDVIDMYCKSRGCIGREQGFKELSEFGERVKNKKNQKEANKIRKEKLNKLK